MRRRALLASASATQSNINPEFAFEWHLQYPEEGAIRIYAKDDENAAKAFDTLLRIHTALGENLDDTNPSSPSIPREFNWTVDGFRLESSWWGGEEMYINFETDGNNLYFGQMTQEYVSIINAYG